MPLERKTKVNPLLPNDFRGKPGALLRGDKIYNGGTRAPNPVGRNQHSGLQNAIKQRLALNKAKLLKNMPRK